MEIIQFDYVDFCVGGCGCVDDIAKTSSLNIL